MKLKVYNKKAIDFVRENMMTSIFVADGPRKLGPSTRQKNSVIIFSHTKSITYKYINICCTWAKTNRTTHLFLMSLWLYYKKWIIVMKQLYINKAEFWSWNVIKITA
jgi:hypothetical protein